MSEAPQHDELRRAGRRQWLAFGLVALLMLLVYVGGYFVFTRTATPSGFSRMRVFPGRASRAVFAPIYAIEHRMTGIGAAVCDGSGAAQVEDEWEVIMIDADQ